MSGNARSNTSLSAGARPRRRLVWLKQKSGTRHRRRRTDDRLARAAPRKTAYLSLFPRQRRFAALEGRALSRLISDGSGLIALSYRGYRGSTGRPTEKGLLADAAAAYAFAIARYPAERIVLWGESLGSAVAIALTADKPVGRLVIEAPFTSAADVGARHYWFGAARAPARHCKSAEIVVACVRQRKSSLPNNDSRGSER
jgi:hypothetical protein